MDTEQRLRQLTADFPGTPPPGPDDLAAVVRRGRRAALLHRVATVTAAAAVVVAAALVVPQLVERPTAPIIAPAPDDRPTVVDPTPAESESHDGGVDDEVLEALPVIEDLSELKRERVAQRDPLPSPEASPAAPAAPAPVVEDAPAAPEPEPVVAEPEPAPEPSPEPASQPFEGFTLTVKTSQARYAEGTEPRIIVLACNDSDHPREQVHREAGHLYDLWIKRADTGEWVADTTHRTYEPTAQTVRWEPGQCREHVEVWDATWGPLGTGGGEPVPSGSYLVKAKWMGEESGQLLDYRWSPAFTLERSGAGSPFEGFTVTVATDRATYAAEEQVTIKVRACNTSGTAREQVVPQAGHWFDLHIRDAGGQFVADTTWRTYDGGATTVTWPAGACETWLETWWQCPDRVGTEPTATRVPPGTYTAKVQWLGTEQGQTFGWVQSGPFELTG